MTATAKVFVGLGIAGGLISLTACAAVIVGLIERAEMADVGPIAPDGHVARPFQHPQPQPPREAVVLTPSSDHFAAPPDDPTLGPNAQDTEQIARDRTKVTLEARFVELDLAAAAKLAGDAAARSALADGGSLLQSLAKATPERVASVLGTAKPADLAAALPALQKRGVARVLAAPKLTTRHRLPAKVVEKGGPDAAVGDAAKGAPPRPYSVTLQFIPEVLGRDEVSLEVSAEISRQGEGREPRPRTTSVATEVKLRDGQTQVIGHMTTGSDGGTKHEALVVLLTAQVQPPVGPEARTPLAEAELRQRRQQQCRFVEEEIARQFPESKVELVPAAGKLFVRGTAKDDEQLAGIMAAVRRRVEAWQIVDGPPAQRATPRAGTAPPDNPNVVLMVRTPPVPEVLIHLKLFELDHAGAVRALREGGQGVDDLGLLASLMGLDGAHRSAVLDGLEGNKLRAALDALRGRGLVRVLSEPTLVTLSRRKATLAVGGAVSLSDIAEARAASPERPETPPPAESPPYRAQAAAAEPPPSYPCGTIIHTLPVVLDHDRIRLEVTRDYQRLVEDARKGNPARLVLSSQGLTAVAVMRSGQTLAVGGLPGEPTAAKEGQGPHDAKAPAQQFLLVTAEIVRPLGAAPNPAVAQPAGAGPAAARAPAAPAALSGRVPDAVPPEPADRPSLREFFRKADHASYEEKLGASPTGKVGAQPDRRAEVQMLQGVLRELFPASEAYLELEGDNLAVVARARDAAEAAQIMAVVRGEVSRLEGSAGPLHVLDRVRTPRAAREPGPARYPAVPTRPAARGGPGQAGSPSPPGFDVAESPGPAAPSHPAEARPGDSGGRALPNLLNRLKAVKLPFQKRSPPDGQE